MTEAGTTLQSANTAPISAPTRVRGPRWYSMGSTFREERFFLVLSVFIGLFSGLAVVCFRLAIEWTRIGVGSPGTELEFAL